MKTGIKITVLIASCALAMASDAGGNGFSKHGPNKPDYGLEKYMGVIRVIEVRDNWAAAMITAGQFNPDNIKDKFREANRVCAQLNIRRNIRGNADLVVDRRVTIAN